MHRQALRFKVLLQHIYHSLGMFRTMVALPLLNIRSDSMISRQSPKKLEPVRAHLSRLQDINQKQHTHFLYLHETTWVMVLSVKYSNFQQVALLLLLHRLALRFKALLKHLFHSLGMLHTMVALLLLLIRFNCILTIWDGNKSEPVKAHLSLIQD
jgi:hypothetical protein